MLHYVHGNSYLCENAEWWSYGCWFFLCRFIGEWGLLFWVHLRGGIGQRWIRLVVVLDVQLVIGNPNLYRVAIANRAPEQLPRQREQHIRAHHARDRPRAIHVRVPMLHEPLARLVVHIQRDAAVLQALGDVVQAERNDAKNGVARELVEDEHGVEAVEELRGEVLGGAREDFLLGVFADDACLLVGCRWIGEDVAAEIARQADDGVLRALH
jgi:hypothetical protein